ncbi:MAG: SGNH/GDSL hydrolase family protein [Gammaproteobacteria bacterium]|nr:SGNH/GDSL hydrolase family protein [Gammaproteobacteria bacterium]
MLRLSVLWALCLFLLPLLLIQAWRTRLTVLRLPEAEGLSEGSCGAEDTQVPDTFHLLGLGDSVIAGVGCQLMSQSLMAHTAAELHKALGVPVSWRARGENGARLENLVAEVKKVSAQQPLTGKPSLVLISIGVNNVTGLTSVIKWQLQLMQLLSDLRQNYHCPIIMLGLPDMGHFTAIPQPLRFALGVRAAMLDSAMQRCSEHIPWLVRVPSQIAESDMQEASRGQLLAEDGYHPSSVACRLMAQRIVRAYSTAFS